MNILKSMLLTTVISAIVIPAYAAGYLDDKDEYYSLKLICHSQQGNGTLVLTEANKNGCMGQTRIAFG